MKFCRLLLTICSIAVLSPMIALAGGNVDPGRSFVSEGPVKLSVSVDKTVAQVSDPIQLVVEVDAPRGTRVQLPQLPAELGEFDVAGTQQVNDLPSAAGADTRHWVLRTTLETIKTGDLAIPALDVHFATDAKATTFDTLHSQPIQVRIESVLEDRADPTKFRDIKDTVDLAVPESHSRAWIGWTLASMGAIAALALAAAVIARRKRGPSAAAWAMAQFADLEQLPIDDAAEAESVYNELVDIIREYFELEFNVPVLSQTTREFLLQAANEIGIGEVSRQRLARLASLADEIKFARLGVGEDQVRQALESAKLFVGECEQHRLALEKEARDA
jgi:BatD DUF11 like domain